MTNKMNQCMGCQAGWPMRNANTHIVQGGYKGELVGCTAARYTSNLVIVNNSNLDLRIFDKVIADCCENNSPLPEELSDIVTLTQIEGYQNRWRIDLV